MSFEEDFEKLKREALFDCFICEECLNPRPANYKELRLDPNGDPVCFRCYDDWIFYKGHTGPVPEWEELERFEPFRWIEQLLELYSGLKGIIVDALTGVAEGPDDEHLQNV